MEKGYVVFRGHRPGVYKSEVERNAQVHRHNVAYFFQVEEHNRCIEGVG